MKSNAFVKGVTMIVSHIHHFLFGGYERPFGRSGSIEGHKDRVGTGSTGGRNQGKSPGGRRSCVHFHGRGEGNGLEELAGWINEINRPGFGPNNYIAVPDTR